MASGKTQKLSLLPFSGGMNTIKTEGTLDTASSSKAGSEVRLMENWEPNESGGVQEMAGLEQVGGTLESSVQALFDWERTQGTIVSYAVAGGNLYALINNVWVEQAAGMSSSAGYVDWTIANDRVVFCDGENKPFVWDGVNLSELAPSLTKAGARASLYDHNRLFYFSRKEDTSLVFYSDPLDIESGYDVQFIPCQVNDGQHLTAIYSFFVPLTMQPAIMVGKTGSMGIITGDGTGESPYVFDTLNNAMGIASTRAFSQFGQNCMYLTDSGVTSYITDKQYGNLEQAQISFSIKDQFDNLPLENLSSALSWYEPKKRRVSFAVCPAGVLRCDTIFHYDLQYSAWYKETFPKTAALPVNITAAHVKRNGTRLTGDSHGRVSKTLEGLGTVLGEDRTTILITDSLDFGMGDYNKRILHADFSFIASGASQITIETFTGYGSKRGAVCTLTLSNPSNTYTGEAFVYGQAVFGSMVYGTDSGGAAVGARYGTAFYAAPPVVQKTIHPSGYVDTLKFKLTHNSGGGTLKLQDMSILFQTLHRY
jgi:hypothetical protein